MGGWIFGIIFVLVVLISILRAAKEFISDVVNWSNQMLGMKEQKQKNADPNTAGDALASERRQYVQDAGIPLAPTGDDGIYTATLSDGQNVPVMRTKPRRKPAAAKAENPAVFVPPERASTLSNATFSASGGMSTSLGNRQELVPMQNRNLASEVFDMFKSPDSMRKAIVLSEILNRPESRWN